MPKSKQEKNIPYKRKDRVKKIPVKDKNEAKKRAENTRKKVSG